MARDLGVTLHTIAVGAAAPADRPTEARTGLPLPDLDSGKADDVMTGTLAPGVRRLG